MRAEYPRATRLFRSVSAEVRDGYAPTCTVYLPPLAGARVTVVVLTVVVVFFAVVVEDGGEGAVRGAVAVVALAVATGALSGVVDATAAVSIPWQRCIQKSI
jgi:hypothetical protein